MLIAALKADRRAGKIFDKCLVRASPATADRKDKALVFTGGAVNCKIILLKTFKFVKKKWFKTF